MCFFIYSEVPAEDAEPIVEEPESPQVDAADPDDAAEVSDDEQAEPDLTDEE